MNKLRKELGKLSLEMGDLTMQKITIKSELQRAHHEGYDESTRFWKSRLMEILENN